MNYKKFETMQLEESRRIRCVKMQKDRTPNAILIRPSREVLCAGAGSKKEVIINRHKTYQKRAQSARYGCECH
jgi:hypothetical protein